MSEPIRSLAARYYTDPQIVKLENAGLLARTWLFGCHASDLAGVVLMPRSRLQAKVCLRSAAMTTKSVCSTTSVSTVHTSLSVAREPRVWWSARTMHRPTN